MATINLTDYEYKLIVSLLQREAKRLERARRCPEKGSTSDDAVVANLEIEDHKNLAVKIKQQLLVVPKVAPTEEAAKCPV
jgi:hypothetical protein